MATARDQAAVAELLSLNDLPAIDLGEVEEAWVVELDGALVGCVALERYGDTGLLRSLAVSPTARGRGVGGNLVDTVVTYAAEFGMTRVALLTLDSQGFFARHRFRLTNRAALGGPILDSWEFRHHGCDGAHVMVRELDPEVDGHDR
jgi:amino-acid N-acetyltransferase